jgi:hypothetical protein
MARLKPGRNLREEEKYENVHGNNKRHKIEEAAASQLTSPLRNDILERERKRGKKRHHRHPKQEKEEDKNSIGSLSDEQQFCAERELYHIHFHRYEGLVEHYPSMPLNELQVAYPSTEYHLVVLYLFATGVSMKILAWVHTESFVKAMDDQCRILNEQYPILIGFLLNFILGAKQLAIRSASIPHVPNVADLLITTDLQTHLSINVLPLSFASTEEERMKTHNLITKVHLTLVPGLFESKMIEGEQEQLPEQPLLAPPPVAPPCSVPPMMPIPLPAIVLEKKEVEEEVATTSPAISAKEENNTEKGTKGMVE